MHNSKTEQIDKLLATLNERGDTFLGIHDILELAWEEQYRKANQTKSKVELNKLHSMTHLLTTMESL